MRQPSNRFARHEKGEDIKYGLPRHMLSRMAQLAVVLGVMLASSAITYADNPHFISASAVLNQDGTLTATFKEVGLGNGAATAGITLSADATAVYQCFNRGGNHPQAGNKETVSGPVSSSGTFDVRNGSTKGSLTIGAPGPGNFSCPGGQTLHLISVTYTNVKLVNTSVTPNDVASIPGTFSSGPLFP
jgi:hypothetical protein